MFAIAVDGAVDAYSPPTRNHPTSFCPIVCPVSTVVSPLSFYALASQFRTAGTGYDIAKMRDIIGFIDSVPVVGDLKATCYGDLGRVFVMSSWADMGLYELE